MIADMVKPSVLNELSQGKCARYFLTTGSWRATGLGWNERCLTKQSRNPIGLRFVNQKPRLKEGVLFG